MDSSLPGFRRSFSLPPPKSAAPDPQVEVLFNLPSVRIVSFTTSSSSSTTSRPESRNGSPAVEERPGTLPWVSRFERTIAVGPLRIYRAPGSVAFLNCASALQPILPKSQAWCVDGDSKFVLQIRKPQYWRIEVANQDAEEKARVEELKAVLSKVLLFEKTPCPFQRNFVVELAEPKTPVVKRPWRPVQGPLPYAEPSYEITHLDEEGVPRLSRRSSLASLAGSPYPQSPAASPRLRPQHSTRRPPTPRLSPSKASKSSPTVLVQPKTPELDNISLPHSPLTTPPPSSPSTFLAQLGPFSTPPYRNTAQTSPPCTPTPTPASNKIVATSEHSYDAVAECLPSIEEGETENQDLVMIAQQKEGITSTESVCSDSEDESEATDDSTNTPRRGYQPDFLPPSMESERPHALRNFIRSTTAPPVLSLVTNPPSKQRAGSPLRKDSNVSETDSNQSSSTQSFHSMHSWHSPLDLTSPGLPQASLDSPSYPYPHENIVLPKRGHTRGVSETTAAPETPGAWESAPEPDEEEASSMCLSPHPETPILDTGINEALENQNSEDQMDIPVRTSVRHRATTSSNSRRRELSPLPAAVNLFSPPRARRLQTARHLPTAIIQKTCEILLSPPSHLLHLMLDIASKITGGEWKGFLFSGYGEEVHWDFQDDYGTNSINLEDDYGITLPQSQMPRSRKQPPNTNDVGGSWEVD